jgi:hypothetical protein
VDFLIGRGIAANFGRMAHSRWMRLTKARGAAAFGFKAADFDSSVPDFICSFRDPLLPIKADPVIPLSLERFGPHETFPIQLRLYLQHPHRTV